jgi:hypothetical protein
VEFVGNMNVSAIRTRPMTKICPKCNKEKPLSEFGKLSNNKDGLRNQCKICHRLSNKESKIRNIEKVRARDKKYQKANRDKINAQKRKRQKELKALDPESVSRKAKEKKKKYRERDPERYRRLSNEGRKRKRVRNISYKLKESIRNRVRTALKGNKKQASVIKSVGIPIEELKIYLESKFYPHPVTGIQMSWDNHGMGYNHWQIDHIKALYLFDLTNLEEFLKACHYTNLQPLWYDDHMKKTAVDIKVIKNEI